MTRNPRKQQDVVVSQMNQFQLLASDSESDSESGLDLDSECDKKTVQIAPEGVTQSPQFRVWTIDDKTIRDKSMDTNIFSSPFSRKKGGIRSRVKEGDEGWVSIQVGQSDPSPQFEPSIPVDKANEISDISLPPQAFSSMLERGEQEKGDRERAMIWSEKVKKNLERGEKYREDLKTGRHKYLTFGFNY
jgi:hypothetical protein